MRTRVLIGVAVLALGAAWWLRSGRDRPDSRAGTAPPARSDSPPAGPGYPGAEESTPNGVDRDGAAPPAPASLRGTRVDGDLALDADGHLAPTASALRLFDYFLSARGEEPDPTVRARIVEEIRRRVGEPAAQETEALLDRYLAYRDAVRQLTTNGAAPQDLSRRLQWLRELRRAHFGAALAEALFGEEERETRIALAARDQAGDEGLSAEERARRLESLDAERSEETREARRLARSAAESEREVEALRAAGASDAQVWAAREHRFGADAADRLAALDAERADWERRLAVYRAEREALQRDPAFGGLAPAARESAIEELRARHFSEGERLRVRSLEHGDLAPGTAPATP